MAEIKQQKAKEIDLKSVFYDVLKGHTVFEPRFIGKRCYVKHLNIYDNVETDKLYDSCFKKAKGKGLPTEEEQKKYLDEESLWTVKQDAKIDELTGFVSNLRATKSKLFLKSQIEPIVQQIEEAEKKLFDLSKERIELMGYTAESYANKRSNEIYIRKAIFTTPTFEENSINETDFDHISDEELSSLTIDYNAATKFLTLDSIKKISLLPFFCNYFYLCDDNPMIFFGKPVIELSFFQAELFAFGRYFKGLVQESKAQPSDDIRNDPDKLIEFYEMRKNAEEVIEKLEARSGEKAGASSLVGATKEDLEAIGYQQGVGKTISLQEAAAKKGGKLSMDDFMDLHG